MPRKFLLGAYGALCYAGSLASFFLVFAWLGGPVGFSFPWRLDQPDATPSVVALAANAVLFSAFALYHSLLARSSVKQRLRQFLPRALERATYTLTSALLTVLLCLMWQPLSPRLWGLSSGMATHTVQLSHIALWIVHLTAIVLMNHNEFFGLRQIGLAMRGVDYHSLPAVSEIYYLWTRLMLVISLALIPWASPIMTAGRLEFCLLATGYIVLGAWLSNRDRGDLDVAVVTADRPPRQLAHRAHQA